jgi:hypothetical protein
MLALLQYLNIGDIDIPTALNFISGSIQLVSKALLHQHQ